MFSDAHSGQLTFTVRKKNSDRQSKLVTVSDRESKSEIYCKFLDRENQLFK